MWLEELLQYNIFIEEDNQSLTETICNSEWRYNSRIKDRSWMSQI